MALILKAKGSHLGWEAVSGQSLRELIKLVCQLASC